MQVQKINNQQPQFGNVARVKVSPIFLEDIKIDEIFWKGMKNAPFRFNIHNKPDASGLFDVTILCGKEKRILDKADKKQNSLEKNLLRRKYASHATIEKFFSARKSLIKYKEKLIQQLEAKAQPLEVKSSQEISRIPGFRNYQL